MKVYIVGGTFNGEQGKESGLISKITDYVRDNNLVKEVKSLNGGNIQELVNIYEDEKELGSVDVIMWFANVPNEFDKYRDIKNKFPRKMLITSKRNHGEYGFQYLVNHALQLKSNLVIEFSKGDNGKFFGRVFDPLATVWVDYTQDFKNLVNGLLKRLEFIMNITRVGTTSVGKKKDVPKEVEFVRVVKDLSDTFHELIHPAEGVSRFLGNASFRCRHGFPSFRDGDKIYVTRRNIDKRDLGLEGFVAVERGEGEKINYYGEHKPSVDTPIQLALYEYYGKVNYMVHSHVYIEGAPFTEKAVPCGGLEEVEEIKKVFKDENTTNVAVNLIGHGSLIMAEDIDVIKSLIDNYKERPTPEVLGMK